MTHEIFHTFFDIDRVLQVPNVRYGEEYTRSGGRSRTWEQPSDTKPRVLGISDDNGRLMVLITYNSDLGDAWEWMGRPPVPRGLHRLRLSPRHELHRLRDDPLIQFSMHLSNAFF